MNERRNDLEIMNEHPQIALQIPNSDRSPLYDVRNHACVILSRTTHAKRCFADECLGLVPARLRSYELQRGSFRYRRVRRAATGIASEGWWSQTGSNRRPHACKA